MSAPVYRKFGFRPHGPRRIRCGRCGKVVSSNALAWRSHWRACGEPAMRYKIAESNTHNQEVTDA